jgi:flagellar motor component MotA
MIEMIKVLIIVVTGIIAGVIILNGSTTTLTARKAKRNYKRAIKECKNQTLKEILDKIEFASNNGCLSVTYHIGHLEENELALLENQLTLRGFDVEYDPIHNTIVVFWLD